MSKTAKLDELFDEWKKHYSELNIEVEKFNCDGIINESKYDIAKRKILFILRETNDFGEDDPELRGDLRLLLKDGPRFNIWNQISKWGAGIFKDFSDFDKIDANTKLRKEVIKSVAIMNVKKYTGGSTADFNLLNIFAYLDRKFIADEIDIIDPEIIICCNTFIEMMWALNKDDIKNELADRITKEPKDMFKDVITYKSNEKEYKILAFPHHPADRKKHQDNYNALAELFRSNGLLSKLSE